MRKENIAFVIIFIIILPLSLNYSQSHGFMNSNDSNISSALDDGSSWIINWDNYTWRVKAIVTDISENVYCAGVIDLIPPEYYYLSNIVSFFISKINGSGINVWTLTFDYSYSFRDLEIDSDNNIYSLWYDYNEGSLLLKLNSSGSLLWNYTLKDYFYDLCLDMYGNILLLGEKYESVRLIKLNKSGAMQFNYSISIGHSINPFALRIDEFNNTYIAVFVYGHIQHLGLYKVNASDELILVKELDKLFSSQRPLFDDLGNLYVFGIDDSFSNILFKYNSSGDKIFKSTWKSLSTYIYQSFWDYVTIDNSGNIYCAGITRYFTLTMFSEIFFVAYDENGTLLGEYMWRKYHYTSLNAIHIDQQDNIYFTGISEIGSFLAKNPLLEDYLIYIFYFYLDEESLATLLPVFTFFGVWSLLGISLFVYYYRKRKR